MHEPVHAWLPKEYYFTRPPKFWNSHSAPAHVSCHCARMMVEVGSLLFFYLIWDPSSWRSSLQKQGFSRFFTLGWPSSLWFVTLSSHVFKAPLFFSFFKHGLMGFWAGSCHRNPWSIRIGTVSSMHIPYIPRHLNLPPELSYSIPIPFFSAKHPGLRWLRYPTKTRSKFMAFFWVET